MPGETSPVSATTADKSVSAAGSLIEVANWDGESQEIHKALTTAFEAGDYQKCIQDLRAYRIEPLSYITKLDEVSSHSTSKHLTRFITIGGRLLTAFRPTQNSENDAFER